MLILLLKLFLGGVAGFLTLMVVGGIIAVISEFISACLKVLKEEDRSSPEFWMPIIIAAFVVGGMVYGVMSMDWLDDILVR